MRTSENAIVGVLFPPILQALSTEGVIAALADPVGHSQNQKADGTNHSLQSTGSLFVLKNNVVLSHSPLPGQWLQQD